MSTAAPLIENAAHLAVHARMHSSSCTQLPHRQPRRAHCRSCPLSPGGDSGIGRAVAVHYAREGAHVAILYLNEDQVGARVGRGVCCVCGCSRFEQYLGRKSLAL